MKKKILILGGGLSKEREISLLTGKSVKKELDKQGKYFSKIFDPKGNLINQIRKLKERNDIITHQPRDLSNNVKDKSFLNTSHLSRWSS